MSCNGNIYNIGMGCCEPMLGPIENYYTKPATDRRIQEEISGISAVTIDEVQEMIDEAVSGKQDTLIAGDGIIIDENNVISTSGSVTEEQMNNAIASAKTEIEAEIPSLDGYATEQWVENKHYITGVDLSDYSTTEQMNNAITAATDGLATTAYVNTQISSQTSDFIDGEELSSYTYDKATIDNKIASGGTFDPTLYYKKTETSGSTEISNALNLKADLTALTQVDNVLTAHTADTGIHVTAAEKNAWNAKSDFSGSYNDLTDKPTIPTVPTDISAFNNDVGYITGVDLSNYATKDNLTAATDDMATKTWVGQQGYLTEHQSLSAYSTTDEVNSAITQAVSGKQDTLSAGTGIDITDNVISTTGGGTSYSAGRGIDIDSGNTISFTLPISGVNNSSIIEGFSGNTVSNYYSHAEGFYTKANGTYSHAEGSVATASGNYSHAEGYNTVASSDASHAEGYNTIASGQYSHSEGYMTSASTNYSHAEGAYTKTNASYSHAEGAGSQANGLYSHAEGYFTKTENTAEHTSGQYNMSNKASATFGDSGNTLFSIGNGTGSNARNNAFEVRQNGDIYLNDGSKLQDGLVTSTEKITWDNKQDALTAGTGVNISGNIISMKIWSGTKAQFDAITVKDNETIYLVTD